MWRLLVNEVKLLQPPSAKHLQSSMCSPGHAREGNLLASKILEWRLQKLKRCERSESSLCCRCWSSWRTSTPWWA